ncbi:MAG: transposase [Rhodobacteraceae bacterium]|nr:transposase [Paracoccaceae bacterium]
MNGPLIYFIEFLTKTGRWKRLVETCPLKYVSPNAPSKEEILGTILLSVLSGHRRYAHMTGLRGDQTMAEMLGVKRLRSEDSVRRAFERQDEEELTLWMDVNLGETFEPLLEGEWILDVDATVKTLYGKQEEAQVGYNPVKPGRPSHVYHSMLFTAAKLVLNVDVQAGNQTASLYGQDGLWGWLEGRERKQWPTLVRGDCGHGNEAMMAGCEARGQRYLFKLKQSKGVIQLAEKLSRGKGTEWKPGGQGWEAVEHELQLQGWSRARRVIVTRRRLEKAPEENGVKGQLSLPGVVVETGKGAWYEHAVLVTNWEEQELLGIVQLYRDRGDAENQFDELKNQWGWRGFTTQDLKRSQLMARLVALIYNWWSIYTRMATGPRHGEAITTRPMLQQGVARQTRHANQVRLTIGSSHARARKIANLLARFSSWLGRVIVSAEQLAGSDRWGYILRRIFQDFAGIRLDRPARNALLASSNCRI